MQKQNLYHDEDYCGMLSMCISYKCKYGVATMVTDIYMAEHMMSLTESNSSIFMKNIPSTESEED
jgi:hypothetical protein